LLVFACICLYLTDIVSLRQKQLIPSTDQSPERIYEPLLFFKTYHSESINEDLSPINKHVDHYTPLGNKLVNDAPPVIKKRPSNAPPVIPKRPLNTHVLPPSLTVQPRSPHTPPIPTARQNMHEPGIPTPDYSSAQTSSGVTSLNDIPDDISHLSVADMAECLGQLNLSKYVDVFERNTVDGKLLRCLDEELLVADFGMSRIEARRLMMFALHGWRPNNAVRKPTPPGLLHKAQ